MPNVQLKGEQVEYQGKPVPFCIPRLRGAQVEYQGSPVPLCIPRFRGMQVEHIHVPLTSGIIQNGIIDFYISLAAVVGTTLVSQITPADLLAYTELSSNTSFDAEAKWRYIIVQYLQKESGQIRNVYHRKNGAVWNGNLTFASNSAIGRWGKRGMIIRSVNDNELVLPPTRFYDGEGLVVVA